MTRRALEVYLGDHYAGSGAGRDLAARAMPDLALEIEADQAVLEAIMEELGVAKPHPKRLAAWFASRALKHKEPHELVELEMLALGIAGKLLLWKALKQAQEEEPYLGVVDLDHLIDRATRQFDEVERERMRKAAQLFGAPVTVQYG
jgi:hypothetical protein